MNTCTNCGAALRPGARFCTTCGTRLNADADANTGWATSATTTPDGAQETTVLEAVKTAPSDPATSITGGDSRNEFSRWTSAYDSSPLPADDPASRFISALEQAPTPENTEPATEPDTIEQPGAQADPAATWVTPPPEAFTASKPSGWNYDASEPSGTAETAADSGWRAASSWGNTSDATADETPPATGAEGIETADRDEIPAWGETSAEADAIDEAETSDQDEVMATDDAIVPDAAGFHDGGTAEVDYLSGDENIDANGAGRPALAPDDARARAISLVDELRRMVRLMPGGGVQDTGAAAMALTEASLKVSDFADVREAIVELQDDPRDIEALSTLARKADKIELLLDEHQALVDVIETALQELSGQN